jgi:hypothetical protein
LLSIIGDLIASPFRALAAMRAASAFGWDVGELPDDDELPGSYMITPSCLTRC